jgi:manganese efflux pump family protein
MSFLTLLVISVGLAADAFAVALASGVIIKELTPRHIFRFAFHFGLFQALMPVLGWFAGSSTRSFVADWDHWVAFTLLVLIGSRAIYEAVQDKGDEKDGSAVKDPTKGMRLIGLSIATSIDAFAVGLSLAMIDINIWGPAVMIGVITATMTTMGMLIGSRCGSAQSKMIEIAGGLLLIAIGFKTLMF